MFDFLDKKIKIGSSYYFNNSRVVKSIWSLFRLFLIFGISYIILFPLLVKVSTSFMTVSDIIDSTVRWIPRDFTYRNYFIAFKNMNYPVAFANSLFLTLTISGLQLISCLLAGYGLARFNFFGCNIIFGLSIFTLIVPPELFSLPLYLNFRFFDFFGIISEPGFNLIDSYWPLILLSGTGVALRNGLFILIFRQFFKGMPQALEDAAAVDGAGPFKTFIKIMLPSAGPAIIVVFLFSFVWIWNDNFYTTLLMSDIELLSNNLSNLAYELGMEDLEMLDEYYSIINNTGMLLFILPPMFLYAFVQRYFIESVERTGIVG